MQVSTSKRLLTALAMGVCTHAQAQILDTDGNPDTGFADLYAWYEGSAFIGSDGIAQTPIWGNSQGNANRDIFSGFGQGSSPDLSKVYFGNGNQGARFQDVVIWDSAGDPNNGGWGVLTQPMTIFAVTSFGVTTDTQIWGDNGTGGSNGLRAYTDFDTFDFEASSGGLLIGPNVPANTIQVHTWVVNGATSEHFINGVSSGTVDTGTGQLSGIVIAGREGGSSIADDMTLGDLMVYSSALSTSDRLAIEGYLTDRYLNNPVGDIHNWVSTNATDTFATAAAWDAAGVPAAGWDANVQSGKTQDQVAQVAANATVQFVNVVGNSSSVLDVELNALIVTPYSMTLEVQNGVTLTATNGLSVKGGGILAGSGTVAADVEVEGGSVNPGTSAGILAITGDYTQKSSGVYTFEVEGDTTAGTDYDQLQITGTANLAGLLNITPLNNYRPASGTNTASWTILSAAGGITGSFDTAALDALLAEVGIQYSLAVQGNDLILTAATVYSPGDADQDGDIDDTDLGLAISNFTGPQPDPAEFTLTWADGDTDGDGDVDDTDLGVAISGFTGPLSPASVPEPASAALLALGTLLVARRRQH